MHYFSNLFGKELYMFRTDLLSIIRSLNTIFTAIGICHTSYVDCLLARSGWNILTSLVFCHGTLTNLQQAAPQPPNPSHCISNVRTYAWHNM
jgi:hypothetical protein